MTPIFANSAWVNAPEKLILRAGGWKFRRLMVRYGLFLHPSAGPVLIDTGYTEHSLHAPGRSLPLRTYARALRPILNHEGQPDRVLARFGLCRADVTTTIVTHFHADHVSGLAAFPNARFIGSGVGWANLQRSSRLQNIRHGVYPELIPENFAARFRAIEDLPRRSASGLPEGYDLFGDASVLAIPLPGHADGHFGVLFAQRRVPLLYATDTQWLSDAIATGARPRLAPRLVAVDFAEMQRSTDAVEAFRGAGGEVVLCHDDGPTPYDFDRGGGL